MLIANNLQKARDTLVQADALYNIHQYIGVVNRGYYAMFYAASAILLTKGLGTSKHSGVISLLDREFVKSGEVDPVWSKNLRNAFNLRSWGDYDEQAVITKEQAETLLNDARYFVSWAEQWLTERGWLKKT
ncbi:MAG: HEPN domain-containing protein [Nitrospira sp.]|nr:HEPN domain-containing protein [Nitrospira sp.]